MKFLGPADLLLKEEPQRTQPSQDSVSEEEGLRDMMIIPVIPNRSERQ